MKRNKIIRTIMAIGVIVTVIVGILLCQNSGQSRFNGSRVGNPDYYSLDFAQMNSEESF